MKALSFDLFGTVVDWRAGIARESAAFIRQIGRDDIDPAGFADAWRARYQPAMARVRGGERTFVVLDTLHREMLEDTLDHHGIDPASLGETMLAEWTRAWHRLDPWPDAAAGLARLRARFPLVTLSNGNIALVVALSRRAGLTWDAVLGAEVLRTYKPDPRAYTGTAAALGLAPCELTHVAAHHSARAAGLGTASVRRPMEYGGAAAPDAHLAQDWDVAADSLEALADSLGC